MLYLYSFWNFSSVISLKERRQKTRHSSRLRPMPLRNRVYWSRPKCFRCDWSRSVMCKLRMHRGKFWDRVSMEAAVMVLRPEMLASAVVYAASGAVKD